jgi:hypothetical protein
LTVGGIRYDFDTLVSAIAIPCSMNSSGYPSTKRQNDVDAYMSSAKATMQENCQWRQKDCSVNYKLNSQNEEKMIYSVFYCCLYTIFFSGKWEGRDQMGERSPP